MSALPSFVITTCGKTKAPGPAPAADFYRGSFVKKQGQVAAALRPTQGRLILSNKYGFMRPDWIIPGPYDSHWGYPDTMPDEELEAQVAALPLRPGDWVVNTGAREYARQTRRLFPSFVEVVWLPKTLPDTRIGHQSKLYNRIISLGKVPDALRRRSIFAMEEVVLK